MPNLDQGGPSRQRRRFTHTHKRHRYTIARILPQDLCGLLDQSDSSATNSNSSRVATVANATRLNNPNIYPPAQARIRTLPNTQRYPLQGEHHTNTTSVSDAQHAERSARRAHGEPTAFSTRSSSQRPTDPVSVYTTPTQSPQPQGLKDRP